MANDRSYEGRQAGQQLYAVIEYCSNRDTAWGKIESGKYDWLGVKDRKFIFGRPPVQRFRESFTIVKTPVDADGSTFIEVREPGVRNPNKYIYESPDDARASFSALITDLEREDGSSGM